MNKINFVTFKVILINEKIKFIKTKINDFKCLNYLKEDKCAIDITPCYFNAINPDDN